MPAEPPINARIRGLRWEAVAVRLAYEQYSLAVPIALTVLGGITTAGGGFFLFGFVLSALFDWGADALERGLVISGAVTLTGLGMEVAGIIMMLSRISARRPFDRRLKEIRRELADYGVRASLDVLPVRAGAVVAGTLSF